VTSSTVFLIRLGNTGRRDHETTSRVVGINQIVSDALANALHVESDEPLAQHTRYAVIEQMRVSPPGFVSAATVVYGIYGSPAYRVAGGYIPAVGTRCHTPPVRGYSQLSFTLFLASGARPAAGWPVTIVGTVGDQHFATGMLAAMLASHASRRSASTSSAGDSGRWAARAKAPARRATSSARSSAIACPPY
jgi:hypothetical protein